MVGGHRGLAAGPRASGSRPRRPALLLTAILVVAGWGPAASCPAYVSITPDSAQLPQGSSAALTLTLRDRDSIPLPVPVDTPVTWTSADPERVGIVTVVRPDSVIVRALMPGRDPVAITATVGGITDTAWIRVTAADKGDGDRVLAPEPPPQDWDLVLVRGLGPAASRADHAVVFRTRAEFPDLRGNGLVGVFSSGRAAAIQARAWNPGPEDADLTASDDASRPPLRVTLHLWNLSDSSLRSDFGDVLLAQELFRSQRTGIELVRGDTTRLQPPLDSAGNPIDLWWNCVRIDSVYGAQFAADPTSVHVVYVGFGFHACTPPLIGRWMVVIGQGGRLPGTLAHELGHVLGLDAPAGGDVEGLPGYGVTNIMWSLVEPGQAERRYQFSPAQIFRFSADSAAFVNVRGIRTSAARFDCRRQDAADVTATSGPCPPLAVPGPVPRP